MLYLTSADNVSWLICVFVKEVWVQRRYEVVGVEYLCDVIRYWKFKQL